MPQLRWFATCLYQRLGICSLTSSALEVRSASILHQAQRSVAGIISRQSTIFFNRTQPLHVSASHQQSKEEQPAISPLLRIPDVAVEVAEEPRRIRNGTRNDTGMCRQENLKISPKKLNLICKLVRRLHIDEALAQCQVATQRGAVYVKEALMKARGDAIKKKLDMSKLVVDEIWCTKGFSRKQLWFHAKGKVGMRTKFYSHLNVMLRPREDFKPWMRTVDALQTRPRKERKHPYPTPAMLRQVRDRVLARGAAA